MHVSILTIFPEFFVSPLQVGVVGKAIAEGTIRVDVINLRDFADDRHATTDDRPYGGGAGMVMKPEPLAKAVRTLKADGDDTRVILLSPQGRTFSQTVAGELLACRRLILVCGRYEGVDERFCERYVDDEISIGDYILSGGEPAALAVIDAVGRLVPGVLGHTESALQDTFSRNLLKHAQYTRPRVFEGEPVPEVLLSGDHGRIEAHRLVTSVARTLERRPDLLTGARFSEAEWSLLDRHGLGPAVRARGNGGT